VHRGSGAGETAQKASPDFSPKMQLEPWSQVFPFGSGTRQLQALITEPSQIDVAPNGHVWEAESTLVQSSLQKRSVVYVSACDSLQIGRGVHTRPATQAVGVVVQSPPAAWRGAQTLG
jgi:hypothetical protein